MIRFECPHCSKPVEVDDEFAGRRGQCPGCGRVVRIPAMTVEEPAAVAQTPDTTPEERVASPEADEPAVAAEPEHEAPPEPAAEDAAPPAGTRRMRVPDSVLTARAEVPPAGDKGVPSGRMASLAMLMSFLPPLAPIGLVVGLIASGQARKAEDSRSRQRAHGAIVVATGVIILTVMFGFALMVAMVQENHARAMTDHCQSQLATVYASLEGYAVEHGGKYPEFLTEADVYGGWGMYGYEGGHCCPATGKQFGYVRGLTSEPTKARIVVYDRDPAHGYQTLFWRRPPGRNVLRQNGNAEFLSEEAFQQEMTRQGAAPTPPRATP
jgi:hypothetical protein